MYNSFRQKFASKFFWTKKKYLTLILVRSKQKVRDLISICPYTNYRSLSTITRPTCPYTNKNSLEKYIRQV